MNIFTRIIKAILGNQENFNFEERLVLSSILYIGIICFVSVFGNIQLGLGIETIIIVSVSFTIYLTLYVLGRFYKKSTFTKWGFNIYTFLFCDFYWLVNYGSKGSALFIFLFTVPY